MIGTDLRKKLIYIVLIVLFIFLVYSLPYLIKFRGGFSSNPEDYSYWGSYISGLSTIFTGISLIIILWGYYESKNSEKEIRKREAIKFLIDGFSVSTGMIESVCRYAEKLTDGTLNLKPLEWIEEHEKQAEALKSRLLYLFNEINSGVFMQIEIEIYKQKINSSLSQDQKSKILSLFKDKEIHELINDKNYKEFRLF